MLDRYADTFVLKMYSPVWIPHLRSLVSVIGEQFDPTTLVLRLARTMGDQRLHGLSERYINGYAAHPFLKVRIYASCRGRE